MIVTPTRRVLGSALAAVLVVTVPVGRAHAFSGDPPPATQMATDAPPAAVSAAASPSMAALARTILADTNFAMVLARAKILLTTGVNAGDAYAEVWIRDLNTFVELALQVNPPGPTREALLRFLAFQGPDGDIVDAYVPTASAHGSYAFRTSPLVPGYVAFKNTVESDQEASLVSAVRKYVAITGDHAILDEQVAGTTVRERLALALEYVMRHRFEGIRGLVWGATTADWGDVQPEDTWGVLFNESSHPAIDVYDNATFLIAIGDLLQLPGVDEAVAARWRKVNDDLRLAVRRHLWDAARRGFVPHIYVMESPFPASIDESAMYFHGGTAVAIEAGLLTREEIADALAKMRDNVRRAGASSIGLTMYPAYPAGTFKNPSMGSYSYQNGGDWCWFGGRMIQQLIAHGYVEQAYLELQPMVARVQNANGFYEWWTLDNKPRGSSAFRGSAGVLGLAIQQLRAWAALELREGPAEDADHDSLDDDWERRLGLNPALAIGADGPDGDPDGDGLPNRDEWRNGTHPTGNAAATRFLAEGATIAPFRTCVRMLNPGDRMAHLLLRFVRVDGTATITTRVLGARATLVVDAQRVPGLSGAEFSTVVESDQPVVVDRLMTWDESGYGSHLETATASPLLTWYLAEGATQAAFDLFYLLYNPNDTPATVEITYLRPAPASPIVRNYVVNAQTRSSIWVDAEPGLGSTDVSAVVHVTSGQPIIVERSMYFSNGRLFRAGHASMAIAAPATEWFLAEGATGQFFDLFVLIANPNAESADVQAQFLLPDGTTIERPFTIAARSRFNIWVDAVDSRLENTAVSTIIRSTNGVPVVVERAMWWPGSVGSWEEAHNSPGAVTSGARWAVAGGECGGTNGAETFILVGNTSSSPGRAKVTLMFETGVPVERTYELLPTSRTNVPVCATEPLGGFGARVANRSFGATVESLGATAAPIVVEYSTYANSGPNFWAAGGNALATRLP